MERISLTMQARGNSQLLNMIKSSSLILQALYMCRSQYIAMSDNRHSSFIDAKDGLGSQNSSVIPIIPHRTAPPSTEEIFGQSKKLSEIEIGLLQMQILWLLNRKSTYGYEIMDVLNKIKSTKIAQGTLYPTLKTLKKYEYVRSEKQDNKIVYHITPEGKRVLNETCLDFTRTFFGIFQDFVCHKCVGDHTHKN